MHSDGLAGESYQILRLSTCDWEWVTPLAFRRESVSQYVKCDFRDQGANLGRLFCNFVEHFKTVAQAWLSGFRQYYTYASELMGLGGGTEVSQYRVRFSRDLLIMNMNLGRRFCDLVEHFKTVAQARWLSGFRQILNLCI